MLTRGQFIEAVGKAVMQARLQRCAELQDVYDTDAALRADLEAVTSERDQQARMYRSQLDYGVKLQQLIENLKYVTDTPSPELYHHHIIVKHKQQLAQSQARVQALEDELVGWKTIAETNCKIADAQLGETEAQEQLATELAAQVFNQHRRIQALEAALVQVCDITCINFDGGKRDEIVTLTEAALTPTPDAGKETA